MKIVVLVKEVPDTYGDRKLDLETGLADRGASDRVLDEIGERAVEAAVTIAASVPDTEIVALSVGPETATTSIRKALAMGAASAVHVQDEGMRGADTTLTSEVIAAAVRRADADLVIAGNVSTDGSGGVIPAMVAERLGLPLLSNVTSLTVEGGTVSAERGVEGGMMRAHAELPAVVSVGEAMPDPRMPNFKGIMAAKKKPYETVALADLGVDAEALVPRSIMTAVAEKPPRAAGTKIVDEGDAGEQLAAYLIENKLV